MDKKGLMISAQNRRDRRRQDNQPSTFLQTPNGRAALYFLGCQILQCELDYSHLSLQLPAINVPTGLVGT